ncbi:MAG: efflux RND transporter permease subunit, partial [Candidatus Sulfotelmatobacter sp.]
MNISNFFIKKPIFAAVISMIVFVIGAVAYFRLPLSEYPDVVPPTVVVKATFPGANPKVIADTVASPLEQQINGVEDMLYTFSQATSDGAITLTITFRLGTDLDKAQVQVQNRVAQALPRLPEVVQRLGVTTEKTSPDLLLVVHLISPNDRCNMLYLANLGALQVKDELKRLPGVGDVTIFGAGDFSMRIWLDPDKLNAHNLTVNDVVQAVRDQNLQVAAGVLRGRWFIVEQASERVVARTGFDAVWENDIFGGVRRRVAAAQHGTEAAAADVQTLKVSIAAEVAVNYFQLRSAQWRLDVAKHTVANQKGTLRITQNRRDAGVGEEQDVASAAARVAAVEATIPPLEFEIKRAEYRIAVLSNVRPGELAIDLSPRAYQPISKMLAIGKPEELLQRRPDVLAAERRLAQASETVGVARAQEFPQVSVSAFIGFLAGRGSTFFTPDSLGASVGPSISWSAFDLGRNRARLRGAKASLDESTAAYQDVVLRALEETEDSFAEYRSQHERLVRLMAQAGESKRAADIARLRYREGV